MLKTQFFDSVVHFKAGAALRLCCTFCFFFFVSSHTYSGPWTNVGDERTRHHLSFLVDSGVIHLQLNTWPIPWADISDALGQVQFSQLNQAELWSYRYLRHALERAEKPLNIKKTQYGSNSLRPFSHFADAQREEAQVASESTSIIRNIAFNLSAQAVRDPSDNDARYRFDGSYIAFTQGNWILGLGSIDRWWGPGWQSSLILSNNARPAPGVFLKRKQALPSELPILQHVGPWSIEVFANETQDSRIIKNTQILGARASITPVSAVEIGMSTLKLTGGEEPNNVELMETDNLLSSLDLRANLIRSPITVSVYGQMLQSKKTSSQPKDKATMAGVELAYLWFRTHNRLIIEASNNQNSNLRANNLYEHPYYGSGYRHYGRTLGESADSNVKKLSLGGEHMLETGHQISWRYITAEYEDGITNLNPWFDEALEEQTSLSLSVKLPLSRIAQIEIGAFSLNESMQYGDKNVSSGGFGRLELRF